MWNVFLRTGYYDTQGELARGSTFRKGEPIWAEQNRCFLHFLSRDIIGGKSFYQSYLRQIEDYENPAEYH
jgi:hypothetical protein